MIRKRNLDEIEPATVFGQRLREFRTDMGVSKSDLAAVTGIDPTYLGRVEVGAKVPGWEIACILADALGRSLDEFR